MNQPLPEAPWGPVIGLYFVAAGIAAGVSLVTLAVRPKDDAAAAAYAWVAGWISLATLVAGAAILVADLGRPARALLMLTSFSNLRSPMSVGAKIIAAKALALALHLFLLHRRRRAIAAGDVTLAPGATRTAFALVRALLAAASLGLAAYPALLLARTWSSPAASSVAALPLFVTTALVAGVAMAHAIAADEHLVARLRRVALGVLAVHAALLAAVAATVRTLATEAAFWGIDVAAGAVVPCAIFAAVPPLRLVAAAMALAGASLLRYHMFSVS